MTAKIIDGKIVSAEILEEIKKEATKLSKKPSLAVILVGNNPSSEIYVRAKEKKAFFLGFKSEVIRLPEDTSKEALLDIINRLNSGKTDAFLLQLPLPKHLNEADFTDKIDPKKDVDGFHPFNMGKLMRGEKPYAVACTPLGIMMLLKKYNIEVEGKNCVVVGRSNIVGKPLAQLLLNQNATVTVAHSKTKNLAEVTKNADILISATGKKHLITADMVKKDAIVIDVGIVRGEDGKLAGDVDFENVKEIAGFITPVPGGVGPMTIAMLMQNALFLAQKGLIK